MLVHATPLLSRTLDLLRRLRDLAAATAAQEEEYNKDFAKRKFQIDLQLKNALKESDARIQRAVGEADNHYKGLWAVDEAKIEERRTRFDKATKARRREIPKLIEAERNRWLGALQRERQQLDRETAAAKESAAASLTDTQAKLSTAGSRLETVATSAAKQLLMSSARSGLKEAGVPASVSMEALEAAISTAGQRLEAYRETGASRFLPSFGKPKLGAAELAESIAAAKGMHTAMGKLAVQQHAEAVQRADEQFAAISADIKVRWQEVNSVGGRAGQEAEKKLASQINRCSALLGRSSARRRDHFEQARTVIAAQHEAAAALRVEQFHAAHAAEIAKLDEESAQRWSALAEKWRAESAVLWEELQTVSSAASRLSRPWDEKLVQQWKASTELDPVAAFASLEVDMARHAPALPKDPRLALPCPEKFRLPLALTFPREGSLLFETNEPAAAGATDAFNHIVLRLLATTPPGRIAFTILDPVGLGAGFAGLMHLADYEDLVINKRIWTQRDQIEDRLTEATEHIEKVIQMYLRNDFENIAEYNEQAGSVAEKYHFIVVADFPSGFSEVGVNKLQSIAASGARCGVFLLLHWDQRLPRPDTLTAEGLQANCVRITRGQEGFRLAAGPSGDGVRLLMDAPPDSALKMDLVHKIGKASVDSSRVQVPFSQIAPGEAEFWQSETTNELRVPVGRTGATKNQMLAIGKGTRQHALIAGKTGSGKSTLFHVMITNLALWSSPDQVEFYLIDFKKGVEFKCYATHKLPHAKVVAIESDREFALSVLQRVDEELKRRGDIFRKLGAQDVAGYKKTGATEPMPRCLLMIDEFQEFFVDDDSIAQTASLLLDRVVRQGRAFGIHVILGSQTLGGAYSLARATLGQMAIRVALQCNEADAFLIMDDGNAAPRLLSRPGEGIYNDAAGAVEGNSPFQVVWLGDDERDRCLEKVLQRARESGRRYSSPVVFEGNAPADISDNELLTDTLASKPEKMPAAGRMWLGAPNSIKGPTEATFYRQSGNHLLIVGQRDEAALAMFAIGVRALTAQYPAGSAEFHFVHSAAPGTADADFITLLGTAIPHGFHEVKPQELPALVSRLSEELKARTSGATPIESAPAIYIFIHGMQRLKKLRQEDDFRFSSSDDAADTGSQFNELINEGAAAGIHLILSADTLNNVQRTLSRKAMSEFEMRVVFQMSANDSSTLIDTPRASNLGLHRAIYYNEQAGTDETFRPYAAPPGDWWG